MRERENPNNDLRVSKNPEKREEWLTPNERILRRKERWKN